MEDQLSKSDTERKQVEEASDQSEQCFRLNLKNDISSSRRLENLELADIIDIQAIQPLMNDFYKLTHIPIGINDLKGNVLVSVGWQDICARFHRVYPEASKHCVESDIKLSSGVVPGEFKLYKCKNNMWDIVTPIMVSDQHVGYVFGGQFFFEDEPLDYKLFRAQARKYGFNEEEYIKALEKVPRLSREAVDTGMGFFMTFANILSQLSYSNIKLAHSLEERNILVDELQENRKDFDRAQEVGNIGSWRLDMCKNELKWSDENHRIFGISKGTSLTYETFLSTVHPDDREYVDKEWKAGLKGEPYDIEHRIMVNDKIKWVREKAYFESDKDGAVIGGFGITQDITERKRTEEALRESKARVDSIFRSSPVGIGVVVGRIIKEANEQLCKMTGYSREELLGRNALMLYPTVEEYERVGRVKYGMIAEHSTGHVETCWRRKDGSVFDILLSSSPIIPGDLSGEITFTSLDITERKKVEKALQMASAYNRSLIEASLDPLVTIGPDGKITDVNSATELVTGYSRKELIGTDFSDYFTEPEEATGGYQQAFTHGEVRDYPLEIQHKDGYITPVLYNASIYKDKTGKIIGVFASARDISELKKAEEKIQILANAVESSEDAIITKSLGGIITSWNKGAENIYGYSAEEVLGKDIALLEPESLKGEIELFSEKIKWGEKIHHYETLRIKKDGTIINVSVTLSPVFNASGELVAISTIARDITERKKAEKALKKAHESLEERVKARTSELEEAYKALMESEKSLAEAQRMAHLGNWDWNLLTNELYWSDETCSIFAIKPPEFGATYDSFYSYVHPDDRDYVDNAVKEALNGKPHSIDYRIISADGENHVVHSHGEVILDEENIPVRMKGTVQDITERKKAEEKIQNLANIVESSDDAIITESLDYIITSWNKGAEQVYGYSAEEILGKPIFTLAPPHLEEETKKLVERVKQGERIQQYETLRLRKDGRIINVSITLSPVFDIYGKLTAFSLVYRDITKRKEAEEALGKVQEAHIKEIHHRIKNNLQVISSLLDLQAEKFSTLEVCHTSEVVEAFRESQNRVASMALIHEELYKGDELKTLDFAAYLQNLTANLFGSYNLRNNDIILNLDLEEIHLGMDTAIPLGIIVNELISNALKHAFPAGRTGEIHINLCKKESFAVNYDISGPCPSFMEEKGFHYILTVEDNGKGIPEEIEFPYTNSLGLQLVNILVEQIDGCIELKRNHGTKFTIWFSNVET